MKTTLLILFLFFSFQFVYTQSIEIEGFTKVKSSKINNFNILTFTRYKDKYYIIGTESKKDYFYLGLGSKIKFVYDLKLITLNSNFKISSIKTLPLFGKKKYISTKLIKHHFMGNMLYLFTQINQTGKKSKLSNLYCTIINLENNKESILQIASNPKSVNYEMNIIDELDQFVIKSKDINSNFINDDISILNNELNVIARIPKSNDSNFKILNDYYDTNENCYLIGGELENGKLKNHKLIKIERSTKNENLTTKTVIFENNLDISSISFFPDNKNKKLFLSAIYNQDFQKKFNIYEFYEDNNHLISQKFFHYELHNLKPNDTSKLTTKNIRENIDFFKLIEIIKKDSLFKDSFEKAALDENYYKIVQDYAETHNYNLVMLKDYTNKETSTEITSLFFNVFDYSIYLLTQEHKSEKYAFNPNVYSFRYREDVINTFGPSTCYLINDSFSKLLFIDTTTVQTRANSFKASNIINYDNQVLYLGINDNYYIDINTNKADLISIKNDELKGKISMVLFLHDRNNFLIPIKNSRKKITSLLLLNYKN